MEVVFARGTVTPEQQKKVPLTLTQDDEHVVDGDLRTTICDLMVTKYEGCKVSNVFNSFVSRGHSVEVQV